MANPQSCFSCGEKLPRNYESLMACPSCGTELWDDEDDAGELNGKVIGAALGTAILGAVVWAGIVIKTEYEIGWLAWGIGALIGFGTVKAGGSGMRPAVLAAVLLRVPFVAVESFRPTTSSMLGSNSTSAAMNSRASYWT